MRDLRQRRSVRTILHALIDQAYTGKPITYGELGERTDFPPRFLGSHLGSINTRLRQMSQRWGEEIPPLSAIVVNQETRLPGSKFAPFIRMTEEEYGDLSGPERRGIVKETQEAVYQYPGWGKVKEAW